MARDIRHRRLRRAIDLSLEQVGERDADHSALLGFGDEHVIIDERESVGSTGVKPAGHMTLSVDTRHCSPRPHLDDQPGPIRKGDRTLRLVETSSDDHAAQRAGSWWSLARFSTGRCGRWLGQGHQTTPSARPHWSAPADDADVSSIP